MSAVDYNAEQSLKISIKANLGCFEPYCLFELRLSAGSIAVDAIMTIPETTTPSASQGGSEASNLTLAAVQQAALNLVALSPAEISSRLAAAGANVSVEAVAPLVVQTGILVPLALAPPPPSPLPPPSPTPPSLPPSLSPPLLPPSLSPSMPPPAAPDQSMITATVVTASILAAFLVVPAMLFLLVRTWRQRWMLGEAKVTPVHSHERTSWPVSDETSTHDSFTGQGVGALARSN